MIRLRLRTATLALVTLVAGAINCGRDVTSPLADGEQSARYARGISFKAVFPAAYDAAAGSAPGLVAFANVRVTLRHSDGTIALDTLIAFPSDADSVQVSLSVKLLASAPASGEPMTLTLSYLTSSGGVVFTGGPVTVNATPAILGQVTAPPVVVPVTYAGPGAGATKVVISPKNQTVNAGSPFTFTAQAFDAANNVIPGTPIIFSSSNATLAVLPTAGSGSGNALNGRGTVQITASLLTGGLTDAASLVVQPLPSAIAVASGSAQSGAVGTTLALPVVVRVTAADGGGVSGVAVAFTPAAGGTVGSATVSTDASGNAQTTWKLGTAIGVQSLTATAAGVTGSAVFTATATPLPATKLVVSQQPVNVPVGSPVSTVITALDAGGNTATAFTGAVTIALAANTAGATLGGVTTVNAVAGVASFSGLAVSKVGSAYTLAATSGTLASVTTNAFDITAGAATQLTFTVQPGSAVAGAAITPAPIVTVRDALGNVAAGFTGSVTLGILTGPSGSTLGGSTSVAAVAGVATFSSLSVNRAGSYQLTATSANVPSAASSVFSATAGAASQLVLVSGGGQAAAQSTALPQPVVVSVTDAFGNPLAGQTVSFVATPGNGTLSPASGTTNGTGQVSTTWTLGATAGAQAMTASAAGVPALSIGATASGATGGVMTQLVITSGPLSVNAGATFTTTYEARDATNAVVTTFNGAVSLGFGANPALGTLLGTVSVNAVNGIVMFANNSIHTASNGYTLVATTGSISSTPYAISVNPSNPNSLILVSGGSQTGTVGTTLTQPVITKLVDAFLNPIPGQFIAYAAAPGNGSLTTLTGTTDALGRVPTQWTLGPTAGPQQITASASGVSNLLISATATAAAPGVATSFVFIASPTGTTAGSNFTATVEARDVNGSLATSFVGTVTMGLANNPAGGALAGTTSVVAIGGVAAFSTLSITKSGTGYALGATSGVLSASGFPFAVSPGAATALSFVNQPTSAGAGAVITPSVSVAVLDAFGNVAAFAGPLSIAIGANPGAATLSGTTTVNASAGVGIFNNLSLNAQGTGYTLIASRAGLTPATSTPFNIGAQVMHWTNASGGVWSAPGNWSLARTPTSGDSIAIDVAGTYAITMDVPVVASYITIGAGSGTQTLAMQSGTLQVNNVLTILAHGAVHGTNASIVGPGIVNNQGTMTVQSGAVIPAILNAGTINVSGGAGFTGAFANPVGGMVRIEGNGSVGGASLALSSGFTNQGTIDLTSTGGGYVAALIVNGGTLVNAPGATILASAGAGGSRSLAGALSNQGTMTLNAPLSLSGAAAHHVNTGTITVSGGDFSIDESGASPSFTNSGTLTVVPGRSVIVTNGAFTQQPGAVLNGGGSLLYNNVTGTLNSAFTLGALGLGNSSLVLGVPVSTSGLTLSISNSTVVGSGSLTNAAGQAVAMTSGIINVPFTNLGTLSLAGTVNIGNTFSNGAGATLRVEGNGSVGGASATISNGFTNLGIIDLTSVSGGYSSVLAVANGTLVNEAGASILASTGAGGARQLNAQLDNRGAMMVSAPLDVARASSTHSNTGSINVSGGDMTVTQSGSAPSFTNTGGITVASGRFLTVQGGVFAQQAGATLGGGGNVALANGVTATFATGFSLGGFSASGSVATFNTSFSTSGLAFAATNSAISGTATITNVSGQTINLTSSIINLPIVNQGTILTAGSSSLGGALTNPVGGVVRVQGNGSIGSAVLTLANPFTNFGAIDLTSTGGGYASTLTVNGGTLVNAPGAVILSSAGSGGGRVLSAELNNQGILSIHGPLTLDKAGAAHTNSGTINSSGVNWLLQQSGTAPSFINTGTVAVGAGTTWSINGGTFTQQAGATLNGGGSLVLTNVASTLNTSMTLAALNVSGASVNLGAPVSTASFAMSATSTTINGPMTLTNAAGQTLLLASTTVNAPFVNNGTTVTSGSTAINGTFANTTGAVLRGQGNGSLGGSALTVATGFANNGTIDLTSIGGGYQSTLTVTSGTLTNNPGAFILSSTGAGGGRTLSAKLANDGSITIDGNTLLLDRPGGVHTNTGTITLATGDLSISQFSGTPSFTNSGTIAVNVGRTMSVGGGAFTEQAGAVLSGGGAMSLSSVNATFNGNFSLSALTVAGSSMLLNTNVSTAGLAMTVNTTFLGGTGGSLTNAAGQTMTLGSTTIGIPLTNQGAIVTNGGVAITGAFTTTAGSTLRVEGGPSYGAATLTAGQGFTNNGLIDLTSSSGAYQSTLTVSTGFLTNAGNIRSSVGAGGGRTINAAFNNQGSLSPGFGGTGQLNIIGNLSNSGTITMKLASATAFDVITISGSATLGGTLNATASYVPASGSSFPVLTTGGSITGTFASTTLPAGFTTPPTYSASSVTLMKP